MSDVSRNQFVKARPLTGPPPPKDNELYGDILVIPPIRQMKELGDPPPVYTRFIQVQESYEDYGQLIL